MRPGVHRFVEVKEVEVPVGRHRRPHRARLWISLCGAALIFAGLSAAAYAVIPAGRTPARLTVPPIVHATPGVQFTVGPVLSDPALGGPDDAQQTGDGAANFAANGSNPAAPTGQPMQAPAAGNAPQPVPQPSSSPSPGTSTNPQAMPHPTPDCPPSGHPGRGKKSPKPQVWVEGSVVVGSPKVEEQQG